MSLLLCRSTASNEDLSGSGELYKYGKTAMDLHTHDDTEKVFLRRSKSEPDLNLSARPFHDSVHSEPLQRFQCFQDVLDEHKSCSGITPAFLESESDASIHDLLHLRRSPESQSHRDPVVVFWERCDKQENIESDIIVKFALSGGEVFTQSFHKNSKVKEIKQTVAEMFRVPFSILQLDHDGSNLEDNVVITEIAIERFGTVTFQLSSLDPSRHPLILNNVYPDIPTNDVLTVVVHRGENIKEIIVEIENRAIPKPFLGGYRHRTTGIEYHHAFTQTAPKPCKEDVISRDTQTAGINKVVETNKEKFTQTYKILVELQNDKIIFGDPERRLIKLKFEDKAFQEKVLLIQRNLRSWLVRKMMMKMKEEYRRCIIWEKGQKFKVAEEKEKKLKEKERALVKPESRGDFELLFHNLEEWRRAEADRINNLSSVALRKSELLSMLEMEIQYINSIERQRIQLRNQHLRKSQERLLEKAALPIKWEGSNGQFLCVDSLDTQRARKFRTVYLNLQSTNISTEQRIRFLEDAKKILLGNENPLVPELVSLLDREHHILARNLKQANTESLRDRINYVFLEFIKDPVVNPAAKKYLPEYKYRKIQMYKCQSCQNGVPYYKFSLHSKANSYRKCHNCCWLRDIGGPRIDVNPIRHIFNAIRREELKQSFYSSVALIMQEQDFYHLIINIWLGHSAIGGSGNLEELHMGRWDFSQSWSPWNCILLTAEELKAHLRFANPDQIYSISFVKKIKQRHQMGRIYFSELAAYAVKRTPESLRVSKMIQNFNATRVHLEKTEL